VKVKESQPDIKHRNYEISLKYQLTAAPDMAWTRVSYEKTDTGGAFPILFPVPIREKFQ
jgi:hypothetical protein